MCCGTDVHSCYCSDNQYNAHVDVERELYCKEPDEIERATSMRMEGDTCISGQTRVVVSQGLPTLTLRLPIWPAGTTPQLHGVLRDEQNCSFGNKQNNPVSQFAAELNATRTSGHQLTCSVVTPSRKSISPPSPRIVKDLNRQSANSASARSVNQLASESRQTTHDMLHRRQADTPGRHTAGSWISMEASPGNDTAQNCADTGSCHVTWYDYGFNLALRMQGDTTSSMELPESVTAKGVREKLSTDHPHECRGTTTDSPSDHSQYTGDTKTCLGEQSPSETDCSITQHRPRERLTPSVVSKTGGVFAADRRTHDAARRSNLGGRKRCTSATQEELGGPPNPTKRTTASSGRARWSPTIKMNLRETVGRVSSNQAEVQQDKKDSKSVPCTDTRARLSERELMVERTAQVYVNVGKRGSSLNCVSKPSTRDRAGDRCSCGSRGDYRPVALLRPGGRSSVTSRKSAHHRYCGGVDRGWRFATNEHRLQSVGTSADATVGRVGVDVNISINTDKQTKSRIPTVNSIIKKPHSRARLHKLYISDNDFSEAASYLTTWMRDQLLLTERGTSSCTSPLPLVPAATQLLSTVAAGPSLICTSARMGYCNCKTSAGVQSGPGVLFSAASSSSSGSGEVVSSTSSGSPARASIVLGSGRLGLEIPPAGWGSCPSATTAAGEPDSAESSVTTMSGAAPSATSHSTAWSREALWAAPSSAVAPGVLVSAEPTASSLVVAQLEGPREPVSLAQHSNNFFLSQPSAMSNTPSTNSNSPIHQESSGKSGSTSLPATTELPGTTSSACCFEAVRDDNITAVSGANTSDLAAHNTLMQQWHTSRRQLVRFSSINHVAPSPICFSPRESDVGARSADVSSSDAPAIAPANSQGPRRTPHSLLHPPHRFIGPPQPLAPTHITRRDARAPCILSKMIPTTNTIATVPPSVDIDPQASQLFSQTRVPYTQAPALCLCSQMSLSRSAVAASAIHRINVGTPLPRCRVYRAPPSYAIFQQVHYPLRLNPPPPRHIVVLPSRTLPPLPPPPTPPKICKHRKSQTGSSRAGRGPQPVPPYTSSGRIRRRRRLSPRSCLMLSQGRQAVGSNGQAGATRSMNHTDTKSRCLNRESSRSRLSVANGCVRVNTRERTKYRIQIGNLSCGCP
eukprot:GHVQ01004153.1.p1 GENE.GHVQ01004153.1~~GHVQ01004153.1.p1  ORF type:complete len:1142 (+),score=113.15 GHVQ01004153.1:1408-4833(+)